MSGQAALGEKKSRLSRVRVAKDQRAGRGAARPKYPPGCVRRDWSYHDGHEAGRHHAGLPVARLLLPEAVAYAGIAGSTPVEY